MTNEILLATSPTHLPPHSVHLPTVSDKHTHTHTHTHTVPHPQEDVLGRVKARRVDAGGVGRRALAHDAAGEAGDGALDGLGVGIALAARDRVRHHVVDGALCGAANLGGGGGGEDGGHGVTVPEWSRVQHRGNCCFDMAGSALLSSARV